MSFLRWGLQGWVQHLRWGVMKWSGQIICLDLLTTLLLMQPRISGISEQEEDYGGGNFNPVLNTPFPHLVLPALAQYLCPDTQTHDKMSRLDSKGGIKSCVYFYGSTNNSIWIEFLHSKTNELLNRLDVRLPKSDSCQIANPGPESTAWAELMEFKQKQEEEARTRARQNEQRRLIEQCKKMIELIPELDGRKSCRLRK
ncbi:hypothetical protein WISP_51851 [Willisornis vidua]|uniref:Uncharacterized protein n=1 Tax=Willisornis vidua TaxID=1566151 RepID=A0ABQ9DDF2_9PASS|nr:hypothetical protein WISP_51851 [Willisornis vidua]